MNQRFRVNSPRVMHETIEGEVILIDLETGSYYSLREAGAEIWGWIESGATEGQIVEALAQAYEGAPEEMGSAARALLEELRREGLIEPAGAEANGSLPGGPSVGAGARAAFRAPVLEKHTDMQDLILLDPVHDVDSQGWPHRAEAGSSP